MTLLEPKLAAPASPGTHHAPAQLANHAPVAAATAGALGPAQLKPTKPSIAIKVADQKTRRLKVQHRNVFQYDRSVKRSVHRMHLKPVTDVKQRLLSHQLFCQPASDVIAYEDVFGNATYRTEVKSPYTELSVIAESVVELVDDDPFAFANLPIRPAFPVSWMPWELTMLSPYLTSEELPETQLRELYEYAMSFVVRNSRDLMETLFAINLELYRQYKYVPGSTVLQTTAYDVFTSQQGVCQDFSNLFICLARLMGIPARYVCGYVYCPQLDSLQSVASHAWVELYIPNVGWKGFDPTNGILPNLDHVRVAVGRHYRDTAPIAGTLYTPALETMAVHVHVAPAGN
ncbi:transglutaminase domain-containing protein [Anatilimnocola sp. NA78]|uniref:transglutaminase family protein n=1 Tax=Anatilimnocola sp. NA78 TaxID=3415683 RepID=UPI003CE4F5E4